MQPMRKDNVGQFVEGNCMWELMLRRVQWGYKGHFNFPREEEEGNYKETPRKGPQTLN